jgi:hypothetical protein
MPKMKTTDQIVTRYSMPVPGIWNYTLRCLGCRRDATHNGDLPRRQQVRRPCPCAEPKAPLKRRIQKAK